MAVWGRVQAFLTGAAVSRASSDAVGPVMEPVRQRSNQRNAVRVLDPGTLAELIAKLIVDEDEGDAEALRSGVNSNRLQALTLLAQTWPGLGVLDHLSNRQLISMDEVVTALQRQGFPSDLIGTVAKPGPLIRLFQDILTPGELAAATHRGLVPAPPGILRGEQPKPPFKVEAYPVYDIDVLAEAAGSGYDRDRFGVLVGLQGLPMGVIEAAHAFWRGIITHGDYIRAFNTSNNRNEWAEAVLEYSRQIPTARDFMENALRGHHDFDWAAEQAARHGMTKEDAFLIYQNQGRPLNLHQITQGLAWGGKYEPGQGDNADPWMQSVLLGAVRPEYYDLQRHLKYNLPSALYFRTLQQQGVLTEDEAAMWYRRLGWPPELADQVAKAYAGSTGVGSQDQRVKLATSQAFAALKRSFMQEQTDDQGVLNGLQTWGMPADVASQILDRWTFERLWTEKPLTPAAIKKGYKANELSIDEAVARLVAQQWSASDANIYLTT